LAAETRYLGEAGLTELDSVDWGGLEHAYGRAVDTPRHLAALTGDDHAAAVDAVEHLLVAVLHQGFPCSATAPVARIVAGLIDQSAVEPGIRDALVDYLGYVAEATVHAERDEHFRAYLPALQEALVHTYRTVWPFVDVDNPELRRSATAAAVAHARTAVLAERRPALIARLRQRASGDEHRPWHVRQLAELGDDVTGYLADTDFDVRVTAALAPCTADRTEATAIIVAALGRAAAGGAGIDEHSDPLTADAGSLVDSDGWRGYSLAELVAAAVARVNEFDRIAAAAAMIVRTASWTGFDRTWGPLVRRAFPTPYNAGTPLTAAQRLILDALINNPDLWHPNNGSVALVFKNAGLPHDHGQCRHIHDGQT
jgi:hypothetical protein